MSGQKVAPGQALSSELAAERWAIIYKNRRAGLKDADTARQLGIKRDSLTDWIRDQEGRKRDMRPGHKERKCLRCWGMFPSSGPGNRMCNDCRSHASGTDHPMLPNPGGSTGRQAVPRRP